eukprot:COSAG05_NODE_2452_length_3047_cov_1.466418_2_plen_86_part_00
MVRAIQSSLWCCVSHAATRSYLVSAAYIPLRYPVHNRCLDLRRARSTAFGQLRRKLQAASYTAGGQVRVLFDAGTMKTASHTMQG